eukprot:CAMPEP_0113469304 /NCGR_PEP_ID=MMETSP0014_2-20120614/15825_1 /TAXON_ID=2857 /ORGANISM="Nitzschia sp." /LENGTH=76 /DNA_ID=CAMNT_0000361767 /DNA_START=70 /DNA_END=300 /DNA_ORIENTATION=+ /assembly_acc=CAM_ASM_000159
MTKQPAATSMTHLPYGPLHHTPRRPSSSPSRSPSSSSSSSSSMKLDNMDMMTTLEIVQAALDIVQMVEDKKILNVG